MNANSPPGFSQPRADGQELGETVARDVAQPEAAEERVDLTFWLRPGVANVDVRGKSVGDETFARPIERLLDCVVQPQLTLRGEQRRPPAGPGGELDDLAR